MNTPVEIRSDADVAKDIRDTITKLNKLFIEAKVNKGLIVEVAVAVNQMKSCPEIDHIKITKQL